MNTQGDRRVAKVEIFKDSFVAGIVVIRLRGEGLPYHFDQGSHHKEPPTTGQAHPFITGRDKSV